MKQIDFCDELIAFMVYQCNSRKLAFLARNSREDQHEIAPINVASQVIHLYVQYNRVLKYRELYYPVPMLVGGSRYPVELVESQARWPKHHCYQKNQSSLQDALLTPRLSKKLEFFTRCITKHLRHKDMHYLEDEAEKFNIIS